MHYLGCKSIDFVVQLKPTLMSLFWLSDCVCVFGCLVFGMYESLNAVSHKIGLYTLLLRYE